MPAQPAARSSTARTAGTCGRISWSIIAEPAARRCSFATIFGIDNEVVATSGQHFDFQFGYHDFRRLELSLPGAFQFNNAAIAITLFLVWLQREQPRKTPDRIEAAIRAGLREARWPGRLEVIQHDPLTVIDVGHTPDGIRQSLASLLSIHGPDGWILVTGVSRDKKAERDHRRADAFLRHDHLHGGAPQGGQTHQSSPRRRGAAIPQRTFMSPRQSRTQRGSRRRWLERQRRSVYVAGGLSLAVEYATVVRGDRAEDLEFF